jgi:hypothetical protein
MRVTVLIASPGDVPAERDAVQRVFNQWNSRNEFATLHASMWESAATPALGDHPQHILDDQLIAKSDLMIVIFWSRLGTPTPTAKSGTVEEIREFIKLKGAARVMAYFHTGDLPYNIDLDEFKRLREFKEEMKSQGLFHEFSTVEEFKSALYHHLDGKVADLVADRLPLPEPEPSERRQSSYAAATNSSDCPIDARLRHPIDFGTTLESISGSFSARMAEFNRIDGATRDKFLALGAHVYSSCAECLDRLLSRSGARMAPQDRDGIDRLIDRLRRLAKASGDYVKRFPDFWRDGTAIGEELQTRADHVKILRPAANASGSSGRR